MLRCERFAHARLSAWHQSALVYVMLSVRKIINTYECDKVVPLVMECLWHCFIALVSIRHGAFGFSLNELQEKRI